MPQAERTFPASGRLPPMFALVYVMQASTWQNIESDQDVIIAVLQIFRTRHENFDILSTYIWVRVLKSV